MAEGRDGQRGGLRARKMARTRAAIEDAALRLFLERGYVATTIDEIAAAVEVSPRTVLRYFGSKEDVLFARERETVRLVGELLAARPAGEAVLPAARAVLARVAADYDAARERRLAWARLVRATPALAGAYLELLAGFEAAFARFAAGVRPPAEGAPAEGAPAEGAPAEGPPAAPERATVPRLQAAVVVAAFRVALEAWEAGEGDLPALVAENLALLDGDLWR
jgi:AcrR family transcriptional regulator